MEKIAQPKELVVSIHDVSPLTRERTQEILDDLRASGIGRVSLLVIPDHHRRGTCSRDEKFAKWLRETCAAGHEAVLHGYYHLRAPRSSDGPWKRLVTGFYTAGEGEFYDLGEGEARGLLAKGRAEISACGVTCSGFIAPAWLLGEAAERAVRAQGFEYTTRVGGVKDLSTGAVYRSRSLVWSVRARWRRACSLAWNAALFRGTSGSRLMRIGIHPPDWDHPAIREQTLSFAAKALAGREAMTYQNWIETMRSTK